MEEDVDESDGSLEDVKYCGGGNERGGREMECSFGFVEGPSRVVFVSFGVVGIWLWE